MIADIGLLKIVPLDDYNATPCPGELVGAITTNWGNSALRHGWKIIEIWDEKKIIEYK